MMPPIAVAIPIFLMFQAGWLVRYPRWYDTAIYSCKFIFVSLAFKGFIDEIPREYEEAALIDGYTRFQAFYKVVLPQAATGIASTAIFCLIFSPGTNMLLQSYSPLVQRKPLLLHTNDNRSSRAGLACYGSRRYNFSSTRDGFYYTS